MLSGWKLLVWPSPPRLSCMLQPRPTRRDHAVARLEYRPGAPDDSGMIRLGRDSIMANYTEKELVPRAAQYAREYMATLWDNIQACDPPVTLRIDSVSGGGVSLAQCLVAEPTDKRLRHYKMLHFAEPVNTGLQMGYYLTGGDRAAGGSLIGGTTFGIGLPTDADVTNVESIVKLIRDYAVAPSIQYIVDLVQGSGARRGGFAGA